MRNAARIAPRRPVGVALVVAVLLAAPAARGQGDDLESLTGPVPVDQFNPDVKAKDGSESRPVRGGVLRLRTSSDPKSLNPMCDSDSPTRQVYQYLGETLAWRDRETFEWLPNLVRWWATRDTLTRSDGQLLSGRILDETDDGVRFAPGASRYTFATIDLLRFEPDDGGEPFRFEPADQDLDAIEGRPGRVVPRPELGLPAIRGTVRRPPAGRFTVWVEETPSEVLAVPHEGILVVLEGDEGAQERVLAVRREAEFELALREGVRWHDGQPVTAADVTFSFDCIMNPAVDAADLRQYFQDLVKYEQLAPGRVLFRFGRQFFLAFSALAESARIYPRHRFGPELFAGDPQGFGRHFNQHKDHQGPVGCGPYRFSRWEHGRVLEIVRNDAWWASPPPGPDGKRAVVVPWIDPLRPYLDRIQWIVINNKNAALKALREGEVDADLEIEPTEWQDPETNTPEFVGRFVRAPFLQPLYTYIGWNMHRKDAPPERQFFADRRVRQAMTYLIPRRRILAEIHRGLGEVVTGPFFKYGPFCDRTIDPVDESLRRAELLLDEAGWIDHDGDGVRDRDGVAFEFEYLIHNAKDYHQKIADIVKESVERAGVRMVIRKLDWGVFVDTVQDQRFDAVRFAWGEPSCIDAEPFQIWHSSQSAGRGSNYISFHNAEVDRIIMTARRELDVRRRQVLYRRLHRVLHREQPYTFMFNFYALYFYARKVRNVRFTIIGEDPFLLSEWYIPRELQAGGVARTGG